MAFWRSIYTRLQAIIHQYNTPPSFAPYETLFVRIIITIALCWTYRECPLEQAHPRGLSVFIDLQPLCVGYVFHVQKVLMWIMAFLYILRVFPVMTCSYLAFNYIAQNTVYNSYAIFHGNQILGQIFMVRALAHIYFAIRRILATHNPGKFGSHPDVVSMDEEESRLVRLGQEVMAAAYFASVITKIWQSDGRWIQNSHYFIISSMVTRERAHLWGELPSSEASVPLAMLEHLLTVNTFLPKIMFSGGFFTELFAPLFLYNRPVLLFGGIMIFQMHYWIQWIMQLTFGVNMYLATAHFILPLYWLHLYFSRRPFGRLFDWLQRYPKLFGTTPPSQTIQNDEDSRKTEKPLMNHSDQKGIFATTLQIWRKIPFKLIILLVILSLYLQESFPFSHWPMYANPIPQATYMQIQDKLGYPLMPSNQYIRSSLSQVNKHFKSLCKEFWGGGWDKKIKKEMKCGNATLYSVMKYTPLKKRPELERRLPLRLVQTVIKMDDDNKISRQVRIVGYLEKLPPSAWE